jgi:L-2-hydroxyglutarate oxidase LhgO
VVLPDADRDPAASHAVSARAETRPGGVGIVGAGIVGLALARELLVRRPGLAVTVLDKEADVARHQTGHNSGVVHAGLYYKPGSLKATLCSRGRGLLREFCAEHRLDYRGTGKLVVAVADDELAGLHEIHARASANGVPDLEWRDGDALREIEPHVVGRAAVYSPRTAVVDYAGVARALRDEVVERGGAVLLGQEVTAVRRHAGRTTVRAADGTERQVDQLVLCAGLQSDRLARLAGGAADPAIVPFLGMYYALRPARRDLVRSLIYPVPDPRYPFLGVHLTRTVDGEVLIGPNALLTGDREGYAAWRVRPRDLAETLRWPGFRRLAREHWRQGARELVGAGSRRVFVAGARRYVPSLTAADVVRSRSGIRAQAVWADGRLADDFVLEQGDGVLAVRNAPSPAATSSLAIAEHLAKAVLEAAG